MCNAESWRQSYTIRLYRHNAFHLSHDLLGSCLFEKTSPLYWAVKLCFKLRRKVWICEIWRVILLHEVNNARQSPLLPVIPKPLGGKTWNRENSPVYEDSEFCIVIPIRQGSGIKRFPIRVISNCQRHICQQLNHENDPKNLAKFWHDQMKSKSRARDRHVVLFTKVTWPRRSYRGRIEKLPECAVGHQSGSSRNCK